MISSKWRFRAVVGLTACVVVGTILAYPHFRPNPDDPPPEQLKEPESIVYSLPEEERAYLWEAEHHGNILSQIGFKSLATALSENDAGQVAFPFAVDFIGGIPTETTEVILNEPEVKVTRATVVGAAFQSLDRDSFVDLLMSYRELFRTPPRVKFDIVHISPEVRGQMDGPWVGQCLLRLWGEWSEQKPAEVVLSLDYRIDRPTKERVKSSGWIHSLTVRQTQVGKAEQFLFRDVTSERGLDSKPLHDNWLSETIIAHTGGVALCDFNRDGRLDVFITEDRLGFLYQGIEDGRFVDVTAQSGLFFPYLDKVTAPCTAWVDLDGDGWEDLVHARRIWRNIQGQRFEDMTTQSNLRIPLETSTLAVADFDRDGRMDLYASLPGPGKADSWISGKAGGTQSNLLFRNLGDWQFEDVSASSGAGLQGLSTFTSAWLDANNDGWPDLHVINEVGDGVLLINQHDGTFRHVALADEPVDFGSMGLATGDLDNDGNIDLYIASMYSKAGKRIFGNLRPDTYPPEVMHRIHNFVKGNELHRNLGGLRFQNLGTEFQIAGAGWAYGPALVDFNNDGWLDIHSTTGFISRSRDEPDG